MAENEGKRFKLGRMYLKDASYETPMGVKIFEKKWEPEINLNIHSEITPMNDDNFELSLTATVTAKLEGEVAFLIEVKQAGQFLVKGFEGEDLSMVLNISCPTVLFPYLREVVDSLACKGGLPPLRLQPINFEAIYEESKAQRRQQTAQEGEPPQH